MTKTTIKTVKQLPEWFKLEHYNQAKDFNADDWYDELMPRLFLRYCLKQYEELPYNWEIIKRDGLLYYVAQTEEVSYRVSSIGPFSHEFQTIDKKKKQDKAKYRSVYSLSNMNMYGSYWVNTQDQKDEIAKKMNIMFDAKHRTEATRDLKEALEWLSKPFDNSSMDITFGLKDKFGYARVELDASDEQIKQDFASWLADERNRRNVITSKKSFNEVDFTSWYDSSVLPYLDLMFWAEMDDVKINQYVIAQAIFHDAYALGSDVDPLGKLKTTKKKAEYLMDYEVMKLLELQINTKGDFAFLCTYKSE